MKTRVRSGSDVLDDLGPALDELHGAVDAPVTARRPWLERWVRSYPDHEPLAIAVEADGQLAAAALLAVRRGVLTRVVAAGHGPSDVARLPARSGDAVDALADGVVGALRRLGGRWALRIDQVAAVDAAGPAIAARVPVGRVSPGDASPILAFSEARELEAYASRNFRQSVRSAWNRIRKEREEVRSETLAGAAATSVLPEVERVHRARDRALGRRSDLDDPRALAFWRGVIEDHARRGEVEITGLWIEGRIAGYVVGFLDGPVYRMWDARLSPEWDRYSAGRLAVTESIRRALEDPRFHAFDFMRGVEDYKMRLATGLEEAVAILGWSGRAVQVAAQAPRSAMASLRRARDAHPALARVYAGVKRTVLRR